MKSTFFSARLPLVGYGLCILGLLLVPTPARAWGPGMHFYLADRILELGLISGGLGTLIKEHERWFLYGSVIADVVIGKGFLSYEEHSHNWELAKDLRKRASTEDEETFALGLWMHLAADTVAHNEFVPDKLQETRMPDKLGHAYWEFRAERWLPDSYWHRLERLIDHDFRDHEDMLEDTIRGTVLPFPINWTVVKSHLKISTWESWRRLSDFYARLSKHDLSDKDMDPYVELCLERMADSVEGHERENRVLKMDPTGDFPEHHDHHEVGPD